MVSFHQAYLLLRLRAAVVWLPPPPSPSPADSLREASFPCFEEDFCFDRDFDLLRFFSEGALGGVVPAATVESSAAAAAAEAFVVSVTAVVVTMSFPGTLPFRRIPFTAFEVAGNTTYSSYLASPPKKVNSYYWQHKSKFENAKLNEDLFYSRKYSPTKHNLRGCTLESWIMITRSFHELSQILVEIF